MDTNIFIMYIYIVTLITYNYTQFCDLSFLNMVSLAADSQTSPNFDFVGVIVISLALLCDAVIGNVQEKAMKQFQASNNEVVFYSYAIASIYLLAITSVSGIMINGFVYCSEVIFILMIGILLAAPLCV